MRKKIMQFTFLGILIIIMGCGTKEKKEPIDRLSTNIKSMLQAMKVDSAALLIDSLKSTKSDTANISRLLTALEEKKKLLKNIMGTYVFNNSGVSVEITLMNNKSASLKAMLNGQQINGVNSKGVYSLMNDSSLKVDWLVPELNKTMSELLYNDLYKTLSLTNGNVYKRKSNNDSRKIRSETATNVTKVAKPKNYVTFCGEQYEEGTKFRKFLPNDYEERAGFYCLKNYREGASSVYYSGFNKAGILVTAVGESTGEKHIILFMCNGGMY
jgi:hypothetical protein